MDGVASASVSLRPAPHPFPLPLLNSAGRPAGFGVSELAELAVPPTRRADQAPPSILLFAGSTLGRMAFTFSIHALHASGAVQVAMSSCRLSQSTFKFALRVFVVLSLWS
ncbi:2-[(L-alanin-3-ylcarbamoyl)methyl]-2-hydroxybutanedioate decarboxylase [Frankliniella fusca]|uniref:2-[(L-alanin-3-ylcarbamoyl)methyl]-2-hydroxybutanedioate decarboxylase n=1 Tax=Frankliniella fusca TaxID=407009 RepID=A0AAE1L8A8_9NEOP|nr:2-[(L-alanin-3-ylcarbamoyl)methyl]-2-hydroxybutanedioate decarboxylase [Frankliniella fusca]KAK3910010.1 2-[(L-alanin-3-ylcarbamoyl)methyl]-2-hydroxybutanedioate decarboxylase [Frankliniella fusca]